MNYQSVRFSRAVKRKYVVWHYSPRAVQWHLKRKIKKNDSDFGPDSLFSFCLETASKRQLCTLSLTDARVDLKQYTAVVVRVLASSVGTSVGRIENY